MKNKILYYIVVVVLLSSCHELDLNPLSEGSSGNWYSNEQEVEMAVGYLFNIDYWDNELTQNTDYETYAWKDEWTDSYSDDWTARSALSVVTGGTINGQSGAVVYTWKNTYTCIAAANRILENIDKASSVISEDNFEMYKANAKFVRASQYARLIFLFGDVPYYTETIDIDEAFAIGRTSKETILNAIYEEYDYAAEYLPESYSSSNSQFATKGAALAMKARIALYMGDYEIAKTAAKACMDLGVYELYPDYRELFLPSTKNSVETIFCNPRSVELGITYPTGTAACFLSRLGGGYANGGPSWDLFFSYLCTDGLPVDESPLFDPHDPFKNRDPRCNATIVEFGTEWLGYIYEPHPDSTTCLNTSTGKYVSNLDCRTINGYASWNGLVWKKRVDDSWLDKETEPDNIIMRYADVLLMYAEAKIELSDIDQSVLDAINQVRARAYGVSYSATGSYPAVTTTDQDELRKSLRTERRMEFAVEGRRYSDLIRWKLAEKALTNPVYGFLAPDDLKEKIVEQGGWLFPETPDIDEDGLPDLTSLFNAGYIQQIAVRSFDASKQYLWPIPTTEVQINDNITQNSGY